MTEPARWTQATMSLFGLLRHLVEVERDWHNWIGTGSRSMPVTAATRTFCASALTDAQASNRDTVAE